MRRGPGVPAKLCTATVGPPAVSIDDADFVARFRAGLARSAPHTPSSPLVQRRKSEALHRAGRSGAATDSRARPGLDRDFAVGEGFLPAVDADLRAQAAGPKRIVLENVADLRLVFRFDDPES